LRCDVIDCTNKFHKSDVWHPRRGSCCNRHLLTRFSGYLLGKQKCFES
jgi:hypothetical protein